MATRQLNLLASAGLAVGGAAGMAGTFLEPPLRGLLWTIDGSALVMASAILAACFLRAKQDLAAAGFIAFAIGQGLVISTAGQDVVAGAQVFGAGAALWAVGLAMVSGSSVARSTPLFIQGRALVLTNSTVSAKATLAMPRSMPAWMI